MTITVFGSSRPRPSDPDYELAYALGSELARAGFTVCNGGYAGIMEASARGAKEAGGSTVGVTFTELGPRTPNRWIDRTVPETTLISRMMRLIELGDAYVVLKGGTGTLLELAAVWEHINKGLLDERPIVIVGSFWTEVVNTLSDELAWEGLEACTRYVEHVHTAEQAALLLKAKLSRTSTRSTIYQPSLSRRLLS
jgi:uncharacterized protein (TIGR00730 family)